MRTNPLLSAACWAALVFVGLAGCDGGDLAQPARDHRQVDTAAYEAPQVPERAERSDRADRADRGGERAEPTLREVGGQPVWSDNRRYSAAENAAYHFEQHGQELGAKDVDSFVRKAHAFLNDPPKGAKTKVRWNGDRMVYDPKSGLFGVMRKDGAPRTIFKPDDGDGYWAEQVREADDRSARRTSGGGERRRREDRSEG